MKLVKYRVRNYKTVLDSHWINVINENSIDGNQCISGSENLLEGLYKFNSSNKNYKYSLKSDWPTGLPGLKRSERICYMLFEILDDEWREFEKLIGIKIKIESCTVIKLLSNDFRFRLDSKAKKELKKNKSYPDIVTEIEKILLNKLPTFIYLEDYMSINSSINNCIILKKL